MLFDPIRRREVTATPEEHVRQAVVRHWLEAVGVPPRLMAVEFDLRRLHPRKRGRLDVVAFEPGASANGLKAWAIAECKAPDIAIDESTARQLERYLAVLPCRYLMATNGRTTVVLEALNSLEDPDAAVSQGEHDTKATPKRIFRRLPSLPVYPRLG